MVNNSVTPERGLLFYLGEKKMKWIERIVFIAAVLVVANYFLDIVERLKVFYVMESFE